MITFDKVLNLTTEKQLLQRYLDISFDKIKEFSRFEKYSILTNTITQSIPNAVTTVVVFDKIIKNPSGFYDATIPSRITCKVAGLYSITTNFSFVAGAGNLRIASVVLNGSLRIGQDRRPNYSVLDSFVGVNVIYPLEVNDYIQIIGYQDSGGPLDIHTSATPDTAPTFAIASLTG